MISCAWSQQCGLPTDGSADATYPDRDHLDNWHEWRCGTNPTNSASVLKLLSLSQTLPGGMTVSLGSVT